MCLQQLSRLAERYLRLADRKEHCLRLADRKRAGMCLRQLSCLAEHCLRLADRKGAGMCLQQLCGLICEGPGARIARPF